MAYKINGTEITLQPTSGRWINRDPLGFTGDGHIDYSGVREFEMKWQLISMDEAQQLQGFFNAIGLTGTVSVDIPRYRYPWAFYTYSGCTLGEPTGDQFFEEYETNVTMLVYGIVT